MQLCLALLCACHCLLNLAGNLIGLHILVNELLLLCFNILVDLALDSLRLHLGIDSRSDLLLHGFRYHSSLYRLLILLCGHALTGCCQYALQHLALYRCGDSGADLRLLGVDRCGHLLEGGVVCQLLYRIAVQGSDDLVQHGLIVADGELICL